jgi:hypothetical protein
VHEDAGNARNVIQCGDEQRYSECSKQVAPVGAHHYLDGIGLGIKSAARKVDLEGNKVESPTW